MTSLPHLSLPNLFLPLLSFSALDPTMRSGAQPAPTSSLDGAAGSRCLLRPLDLSLRITVLPLTAASLWLMATNKQTNDAYGRVEFSDITGLKYLVSMNVISGVYAAASALLSFLGFLNCDRLLFVLDQAVAYLMVTSGAAATEVVYLAYEGAEEASWSEGCSYYGKFCSKAKVSLSLHFVAFLCFLALSLVSAYRVFSKLEAPPLAAASSSSAKGVGEQLEI